MEKCVNTNTRIHACILACTHKETIKTVTNNIILKKHTTNLQTNQQTSTKCMNEQMNKQTYKAIVSVINCAKREKVQKAPRKSLV